MPMLTRVILSAELPAGKVPTEFRLFAHGENPSTKGVFIFDDPAAQSVMTAYASYGNDLVIDYNHASLGSMFAPNPAEAGKASGWFRPELRNGELWASGVTWTPAATQSLENREYRFFSQTFMHDENGRIVELINVALTNNPASTHQTPLMASRGDAMTPEMRKMLSKLLGLAETATDEEIGKKLQAKLSESAPTPAPPAPAPAPAPTMKCTKCSADMGTTAKFCSACGTAVPDVDADPNDIANMPEAGKAALSRARAELAQHREELTKIRRAEQLTKFKTEATGYKALAVDPEKFGATLMELSEKAPAAKTVIDDVLKRANAALANSPLLAEAGTGGANAGETATQRLDRLVGELQKKEKDAGKKLSKSQATSRVLKENPDLYNKVREEEAAAE